ncbi:MAG: Membrane protein involved in aromatic hydrocarbon degradation [Chthoniobacteraceae bacterium]|nr:Membrane protein involved in aromatic hydrocarbon degradation [Chthoniobacteraceae bacterium]
MKSSVYSFAVLAMAPCSAFALGVSIIDQDAHATARGNAFTATADNPSAIYYNPAGITQIEGLNVREGFYGISLQSKADPDGPNNSAKTESEYQAAPQYFLTYKPHDSRIAVGLGIYAPFGFGLKYPDNTAFRTLAKEGRIVFVSINPVVAWQVTKTLSIAAAPAVNEAHIKLSQGVVTRTDNYEFRGEGVGYGINAGLLWAPHPMHSLGLTYRSATSIDFSGHSKLHIPSFSVSTPGGSIKIPGTKVENDANLDYNFPQSVVAGYSFRPTPLWNLEANIEWTDWDSLNTVTLRQSKSADIPLQFNWESSFSYKFGVTRELPRGLNVSAGYLYSENSVPNESFNPLIPDSNRHVFSIGIGQQFKRLSWDLAYQHAHGPERRIENGTLANGTYRFKSNALTFTVGFRF